jgi:tricorn protease
MRTVSRLLKSSACLVGGACLIAGSAGAQTADGHPGYLVSPDISDDRIVFSAEGDLWLCRIDGSAVQRITSHPGTETSPRFSPDGRWIAFSGDYDGNRDVFVMPAGGGEPRRLTWHPGADLVITWTPDGEKVIFSSRRDSPHGDDELYSVSFRGGEPEALPVGRVNWIDIDPQSGAWAFTRTWGGGIWKRYRGGRAPEIWVGHPDRGDFTEVTRFDGIDSYPMWHGGRIYFLSDQGGTANLWSMSPDGSARRQLTRFEEWDARYPAMGPDGKIVFSLAGDLHFYDPETNSERALAISLPSERNLTRKRYPDPAGYISEFALSPDGERVLVVTRGKMFSVPVEEGVTLPISRGSGARECRASFGPKGERVVYVTDESHEEAIVTADAWGRGEVKVVKPAGQNGWHFPPAWSPDGKWIAYADMTQTLYVNEAEGGTPRRVDHCESAEISEYAWSPDGRWLAYAKANSIYYSSIFIYDVQSGETHQVTDAHTDNRTPAWDPDGRYLYFLSDRTLDPVIDWFDFETIITQPSRPYLALLRPDVENPFAETAGAPPDAKKSGKDEGKEEQEKDEKGGKDEADKEEEPPKPVEIEFAGLGDRIVEFPVDPGRYFGLAATSGKVFYLSVPLQGLLSVDVLATGEEANAVLMAFDLKEKKADTFMAGVSGFDLQPQAGKVLVSKGHGQLYVVAADATPGEDLSDAQVALDGVVVELAPQEEWEQIYYEAWRNERDFYWDEGMHGVDWAAIGKQYARMLPRIAVRPELGDLLAEMIGELSNSHTYVWGGDLGREVPRFPAGLLGARFERAGDYFRVARIFRGGPPDRERSPLEEPGVNVREGDYILAVNQRGFAPDLPFEASLENLAGKPVLLTVNDKPQSEGSRQVVVTPMRDEGELIYADWVRRNREYVTEKTGGRIGYIHLPDMMGRGLSTFDAWFYPQLDCEGMIVDARWNGGGMVSQLILERLRRPIVSWGRGRYGGRGTYPFRVLNGPFVVLTNERAGSDGDIFPAAVQLEGLAPVIGTRSWGGVVGIRGVVPLVDGGSLTRPESPWWDSARGWGLEGRGVEPDIEIDNLPQELAQGKDAQLDRAIQEVMSLHAAHPPLAPDFGPAPDRSRKAYRGELPGAGE